MTGDGSWPTAHTNVDRDNAVTWELNASITMRDLAPHPSHPETIRQGTM
jgi:hypothetical protein